MPGTNFYSSTRPYVFHRSHTGEATAPQPLPSVSSHHHSRTVQFPAAQDEETLYVARRPERADDKEKGGWKQYGGTQTSVSKVRPAVTSAPAGPLVSSTTSAGAAGAQSRSAIIIENPTWWTRLVLLVFCVSSYRRQS
ncbi:hypothetical protein M405DRAFT_822204 [Rhizopogon salebrosus TDB-379]|nr:hypothetical protein M405DRAFT_822204 [Rhizopogon salebrosus TDB-379]